jgi:hypothetical protein
MQYHATKTEQAERRFDCGACGARGLVVFEAVGKSGWHRDSFFRRDDAEVSARHEAGVQLMLDAERALLFVRCPTCGQRARGAILWAGVRVGIWVAITAGLFALSGGKDGNAFWAALLTSWGALFFGYRELSRVLRARKAVFLSVTPGTPPPAPAARTRVPKARAVVTPEPRAAKPAAPAQAAPAAAPPPAPPPAPAPPPPSADGGPRFLRD